MGEWLRDVNPHPSADIRSRPDIELNSGSANFDKLLHRLTSSKDLPNFNGDCLDWMRCKKAFDLSTKVGGFSDEENVARLHRCLRGEAREAVASLLITATSAAGIFESLEMRFGNPEVIVSKTIQKLKRLPKATSGNVDIVLIATEVKNAVASMQALNHIGYLHSPEIYREVLNKLPPLMTTLYSTFAADAPVSEPRLITISNYLQLEAKKATKAGTVNIRELEKPLRESTGQDRNKKPYENPKQKAYTLSASNQERRSTGKQALRDNTSSRGQSCLHCADTTHGINKCANFLELPVDKSWDWAVKGKVCFRCLKTGHSRRYCRAEKCAIDNCGKSHHQLLHTNKL